MRIKMILNKVIIIVKRLRIRIKVVMRKEMKIDDLLVKLKIESSKRNNKGVWRGIKINDEEKEKVRWL